VAVVVAVAVVELEEVPVEVKPELVTELVEEHCGH
jgi:hypothetical protein